MAFVETLMPLPFRHCFPPIPLPSIDAPPLFRTLVFLSSPPLHLFPSLFPCLSLSPSTSLSSPITFSPPPPLSPSPSHDALRYRLDGCRGGGNGGREGSQMIDTSPYHRKRKGRGVPGCPTPLSPSSYLLSSSVGVAGIWRRRGMMGFCLSSFDRLSLASLFWFSRLVRAPRALECAGRRALPYVFFRFISLPFFFLFFFPVSFGSYLAVIASHFISTSSLTFISASHAHPSFTFRRLGFSLTNTAIIIRCSALFIDL